ncbi:Maf-like protein [uncultured Kriegella sp.]|uniref:Maf-like protein n=1 Tax=uncultured Kriegella sp. TaxID=1798910 RepID=UPI0030D9A3F1|tara:strand:- start:39994 stop:40581 length:588 start_codon:yes stop_codon:yes gene_type:complete
MLQKKLNGWHLILASGSPRRQHFFKELKLDFEVRLKSVEEVFPDHLKGHEVSDYLAEIKARPFKDELKSNDILITSDTVVWHNKKILGKPLNKVEAFKMLQSMSGTSHEVITSVCLTTAEIQKIINSTTKVKFKKLIDAEIEFYIDNYQPYDKAGGYGIQEWIGHIGIEEIQGSYTNVMGLPTHLLYKTLTDLVS